MQPSLLLYLFTPPLLLAAHSSYERRWLFHGTSAEVVEQIVENNFDRSFSGKNATRYGKGTYFARDASYSSHPTYSVPDGNGVQRIFVARVAVGKFGPGEADKPAPMRDPSGNDPRAQNMRLDSTVDNVRDPAIFVTYKDGQSYPAYLIAFKKA